MILTILCFLISIIPLFSSAQNTTNSTVCNQTCGQNIVPYPFGFSDHCGIKLNCSSSDRNNSSAVIQIGEYSVHNLTSDHILINIPPKCDRPISNISVLFGAKYAPTWRNGLLLENCSSVLNECVIPNRLARSQLNDFEDCGFRSNTNNNGSNTISCYSSGLEDDDEFLDYEKVSNKGNCSVMFSSIMVDLDENAGKSFNGSSSVSLEFRMLELGWWMDGDCGCVTDANCTQVNRGRGFRCNCKEGYAGDGFPDGEGCRKVSECSTQDFFFGQCGPTNIGILIAGIIAGASFVAALCFLCYCIKRRSTILKNRLSLKRLLSEAAGNSSIPSYPYKEIERATNNFAEKQRLGTGAYGTVYAGKLHNNEWAAIKKIRHRDNESVDQVMNEIKLLSSVSHPNLVRLLGCCLEKGEQILVYEFMPNGTLSEHLQRERGCVLPWTIRLTIAAETAHAISHLHSAMNPPIYHRDIKSSNILLDFNFNSKVADFGLSRFGMTVTDASHISTAPQGTPGYVDPQYHQNYHLSDKSDVYSFGVVLLEIITAKKVVDFSRPHTEINLAALAIDRIGKGRVDEIIDPYLEPNRDAWTLSSVHKVAELAFRCLAFHRDMRPTMMEVADELEQIRLSAWAPLEDNMYLGSSVASSCSSPYLGSEKSMNIKTSKKTGISSRRLIVQQRTGDGLNKTDEVKETSPVSVQGVWLSEQSSPSVNSLLGNVAQ